MSRMKKRRPRGASYGTSGANHIRQALSHVLRADPADQTIPIPWTNRRQSTSDGIVLAEQAKHLSFRSEFCGRELLKKIRFGATCEFSANKHSYETDQTAVQLCCREVRELDESHITFLVQKHEGYLREIFTGKVRCFNHDQGGGRFPVFSKCRTLKSRRNFRNKGGVPKLRSHVAQPTGEEV